MEPRGLVNLGNTCFMNSVIQALFGIPELRSVLKNVDSFGLVRRSTQRAFLESLSNVFAELASGKREPLAFYNFLDLVRTVRKRNIIQDRGDVTDFYGNGMQHDAHDFLLSLLSWLDDLQCHEEGQGSGLTDCIVGVSVVDVRKCYSCQFTTEAENAVTKTLSIGFPKDVCGAVSLEELIAASLSMDILSDYSCDLCGLKNTTNSFSKLGRLSPILIIHLKRYEFHEGNLHGTKNHVCVPLTEGLILRDVHGICSYSLIAVVHHLGESIRAGHYIAHIKHDSKWFLCDDSRIRAIDKSEVLSASKSCYLLVFRRNQKQTEACPSPQGIPFATPLASPSPPEESVNFAPCTAPSDHSTETYLHPVTATVDFPTVAKVHLEETNVSDDQQPPENTCCPSPPWDEIAPVLTESDIPVPTAKEALATVDTMTVPQLQVWLESRGLPKVGNKPDLVARLKDHLRRKKGGRIDPKFRGGKYVRIKSQRIREAKLKAGIVYQGPPVAPVDNWGDYPSIERPSRFNVRQILRYVFERGPCVLGRRAKSYHMGKYGVPACLNRGLQFLQSSTILLAQDQVKNAHYFVKAEMQASMRKEIHNLMVVISLRTGEVCDASCQPCKITETRRCNHIAGLLLKIAGFGRKQSTQRGPTTTDVAKYWGKGGVVRNPGVFVEKKYYPKFDVQARMSHDPRATVDKGGPSEEDFENVLLHSQKTEAMMAFALRPEPPPSTASTPTEEPLDTALPIENVNLGAGVEDIPGENAADPDFEEFSHEAVIEKCQELLESLQDFCQDIPEPFSILETAGQAESAEWHKLRAVRATASDAKRLIGLLSPRSTDEGKIDFLRQKVWGLKDISNIPAVQYGIRHEPDARSAYVAEMERRKCVVQVQLTGLWINPSFPQLACSPDGIVSCDNGEKVEQVLLEIKCLFSLNGKDPNDFEKHLKKKQLQQSCLRRDPVSGNITLNRNHKFYYQVQMSMDILELSACHFVAWTEGGIVIIVVPYDRKFWEMKRKKLLEAHRRFVLPEFITRNALRGQPPLSLEW